MSRKITLVNTYDSICGMYTLFLDMYYNLTELGFDVEFDLLLPEKKIKWFLETKFHYPNVKFNYIKEDTLITKEYDILIVLPRMYSDIKDIKCIPFKYKKIIMPDSFHFFVRHTIKDLSVFKKLEKIKDKLVIFGNNYNRRFFPDYDYRHWHHCLSKKRLDYIQEKFNKCDGILTAKNYYIDIDHRINGNSSFPCNNVHLKTEYFYKRHYNVMGTYFENVGKVIFEFAYLGKRVHYSPENKCIDDGLTEYLSLFGIDDNKEQDIIIPKEEIEAKLFMNEENSMVKYLRELTKD